MAGSNANAEQGCRVCGLVPARTVTIRRHVGMIVLQRFVRVRAPFCRGCGVKAVQSFTLRTLWQGWWGFISFFANVFVLLANLVAWLQLRNLPQPRPAAGADEASAARWRSAFDEPAEQSGATAA